MVKSSYDRSREWKIKYPERTKELNRQSAWRKRGIDAKEAQELYDSQKSCQICQYPYDSLHLDHDHSNGKARGMLCQSCNQGLGFFADDQSLLQQAIYYLDKHRVSNQTD